MMRSRQLRWCCWLWLLCSSLCAAQSPSPTSGIRYFGLTEGLPHRRVNCLLTAQAGYLWVGTDDGLARFDGSAFFRPGGTGGRIRHGVVLSLAELRGRYIWAGTDQGLSCLDTHSNHETLIQADPAGTTLAHQQVRALATDSHGTLYLGTKAGWLLRRYPGRNPERLVRLPGQAAATTWITDIVFDRQGYVWLATQHNGAVYRYHLTRHTLQAYGTSLPSSSDALRLFEPTAVARTPNGSVLVNLARHGLHHYQAGPDSLQLLLPASTQAREAIFTLDAQHRIWYAAERGTLLRYSILQQPPTSFTSQLQAWGAVVRCLAPDQQGGMWAGTSNGLLLIREPAATFTARLQQPLGGGPAYSLRGIVELSPDTLLLGTYLGVGKLPLPAGSLVPLPRRLPSGKLQPVVAYSLLPDSAGRGVWLGTEGDGLAWLNVRTGQQQYFSTDSTKAFRAPRFIRALALSADGLIWLGTYEGIYWFRPATRQVGQLLVPRFPELRYASCYSLVVDSAGTWVGTRQGLYRILPTGRHVIRYRGLGGVTIRAIWSDSLRRAVWLGTNQGLYRLQQHTLTHLSTAQGLANETVNALLPGPANQLWLSTDNGLAVVDRATLSLNTFQVQEGLPVSEFNHGSGLRLADGRLWFGSVNGLVHVRPQPVRPAYPTPLLLTSLTYDDSRANRVHEQHLGLRAPLDLTLQPNDRFFSLSFTLADFDDPSRHRYAYHLAGSDRHWTDLGTTATLRINQLPAGAYTLWLRAAGRAGQWTAPQPVLRIRVIPPFYARWWFIALIGLVLAGMLWALHLYRQHRRRQMEQLRTRIAADLHDDVGSLLTQISLESSLLRESGALTEQRVRLERVADTSRLAARQMRDVVWSLDSRNDSVASLLERMRDHAYEVLQPADIEAVFQLAEQELPPTLSLLARQQLYLMYKEALHNVVKHAQATLVTVQLTRTSTHLQLVISDDGRGYSGPERFASHGLRNMRTRAEQLGGTMQSGSGPAGLGFQVVIRLPLLKLS